MLQQKDQIVEKLIDGNIILKKGPKYPDGFLLKSGQRSDIYINLRDIIKKPDIFNYIMFCLHEKIMNDPFHNHATLLGIPTMGAVIAPVMACRLFSPLAVIRQRNKNHGVGNEIEGELSNKLIIIDDVITSGSSVNETLEQYVDPRGLDYQYKVFVIVDREQHSLENVCSLLKLSEIQQCGK